MGKKRGKKKSFDDYDALLDDPDAAADGGASPVPAERDDGAAMQGGMATKKKKKKKGKGGAAASSSFDAAGAKKKPRAAVILRRRTRASRALGWPPKGPGAHTRTCTTAVPLNFKDWGAISVPYQCTVLPEYSYRSSFLKP